MLKNKLVYKLTAGYVILVLISMLIAGIFSINLFRNYTFTSRQSNMLERARDLAETAEPFLTGKTEMKEYDKFLILLDTYANSRVQVTDKSGKVVAISRTVDPDKDMTYEAMDSVLVEKVLQGNETVQESYSNYYSETMYGVGVPVYDISKNIIGTVSLYTPLTGITSTIDKAFLFLIIAIFISVALTGVLSMFYSALITKPLSLIKQAAIEMTRGNYNIRTNIVQKDEVGQLGSSIDLLASKLGYTIEQLFQESGKLKNLIASISEGILAFDVNFTLLNYNEAVKKLLGYGRNFNVAKCAMKDMEEAGLLYDFKTVIETGVSRIVNCELNIRKLRFVLSPVKNSKKEIIGVVALIHDVSESERLEQIRKEFLANVSHELRTPLTLIQGSIEALAEGVVIKEGDIKKYHDRILQETRGLGRLVNDLTDLSKLESGKMNLIIDDIDIVSLITDVSRNLQTIADKKMIVIETEILQGIPVVIGDYDRIKQILVIFLDNAIKFSPENTKIRISLEIEDFVYIKITDNGIGIPKEDIPFIWERFYKVDKSRQNSDIGIGLGLSIAKHLIQIHNGVISVDSDINKGTTFEIGLPYAK
ncbi:MAG: hypothetical protein A2Y21_08225 [Clostridiales bacterium GWC2_40_7]|nr:MAG: hypothetical protein A2Y21_08225 [Clostridiales bacterium GWC2_40_7]